MGKSAGIASKNSVEAIGTARSCCGVAIIPQDKIAAVLDVALKIDGADTKRKADIDRGVEISDLITKKYK